MPPLLDAYMPKTEIIPGRTDVHNIINCSSVCGEASNMSATLMLKALYLKSNFSAL